MMSNTNRLPTGGRIDRSQPIRFSFNGQSYQGCAGDTVASALLANGVHWVARSWKYHRPRGIVAAGVEEPNALLQLGVGAHTVANARATQVELYEGLQAASVNAWPSLTWDVMQITGWFSRWLPAGFYYKTFMWPKSFWMKYEHFIRKASGLGQAPQLSDPDRYEKMNAHCDVLVVGAGPAGLMAALEAGRSGARVILADEQQELGGSLLHSTQVIDGLPAAQWLSRTLQELSQLPQVQLLTRCTAYGYHDHNMLTMAQRLTDHLPQAQREPATRGPRERVWRVRAKRVVLATGAHERPLIFGGNDKPGILLASAVSTYILRFGVRPGKRCVVFTNNDSAYQTALDLHTAGVQVAAVVDCRATAGNAWVQKISALGIRCIGQSVVTQAMGSIHVSAVSVMALSSDGKSVQGSATNIACDLVAMSGGFNPVVHLSSQSGAKAVWQDALACFFPGKPVQPEVSVGACAGEFSLTQALEGGLRAGKQAVQATGFEAGLEVPTPHVQELPEQALMPMWQVPGPWPVTRGPKAFVDLQNDVCASDIRLAAREGYESIEHTKRYTALGFGTDQGKMGNITGMAILADALGKPIAQVGTTTFRPNYSPVTFGAIAGRDLGDMFDPIRTTPMHAWHVKAGAAFENVGQWKRPWYFPKPGESMHQAVQRECLVARTSVAIMDASTLGKIDIQGADAAEFLNWMYTNAWSKLKEGNCRYGLMLGEDGMVMDDGVTTRLADDHFLMTTTTGGAARVLAWMERWLQTEWPHMKVRLTSVTDHWATAAVVGPQSRAVVSSVVQGIDFSPEAFPHMSMREGRMGDVPCRVMRVSFSGEMAFEVNVNANEGHFMWTQLMAAGQAHNITPYGTETMHLLRAEKGFVIVGQDTDGSVTPMDLGMEWAIAKAKPDFLGKRSLARADTARTDRKQLVGLLTVNPQTVLPEGGQIVEHAQFASPLSQPVPMLGHVTSSYFSASLQRSIALALVKDGRKRMGSTVYIPLAFGQTIAAVISESVFIDPKGDRLNG
jgi:sarcosine oxidase, subunit alpha